MKQSLLGAIVLVYSVVVSAETSFTAPDVVAEILTFDSKGARTNRFLPGSTIKIVISVTSVSSEPKQICRSGASFKLLSEDRKSVLWSSSWGELTPAGCAYRSLEPGQSWVVETEWNQFTNSTDFSVTTGEELVTPGTYLLLGSMSGFTAVETVIVGK